LLKSDVGIGMSREPKKEAKEAKKEERQKKVPKCR